ncbi:MAG: D-aminoacyl-tRNA deacylase [Candidatus ainarchaeum sp.]|nr:D-aminoacyl-tRNA deacylase [Candidatus ainarchaeum sp.]
MMLLFTSQNPASVNIARRLVAGHGFIKAGDGWERKGVRLIDTKAPTVLDVPTDFETDCLLVLSTHRSKVPGKMLTAHVPGNWGGAEMGGQPRTLNIAAASTLKILLQELKGAGDHIGWPVSLEADHHGPTCKTPILFVEIGNGEAEWADEKAAEAVAGAVAAALDRMAKHETFETVFGVGGGHYSKTFTHIVLETPLAVGHILPKYAIEQLDEDTFRQAIEKNVEKVAKVLVAKDETNAAQRERVGALAAKFGIPVERA